MATISACVRLFRLAVALSAALAAASPGIDRAHAQAMPVPPQGLTSHRLPSGLGLERGALIIHGNYCGPGDRGPGLAPIDALDAACLRHDLCTTRFGTALPACACHAHLSDEASAVAHGFATPVVVRATAAFIAQTARVLPCRH